MHTIREGSTIKKKRLCVFSFIWLNFILLECFHFILIPNYSSLQELSIGMFYKGIASTMTDIGPQRVTPLGALLFSISLVYFTLWITNLDMCSLDQGLVIEQSKNLKSGLTSFCGQPLEIKCPEHFGVFCSVQLLTLGLKSTYPNL